MPSSGDIFSWAGDSLLKQLGSGEKVLIPALIDFLITRKFLDLFAST